MRMKENKIMKMISRRDFMKASAVVGAAGVLTAFLHRCFFCSYFCSCF